MSTLISGYATLRDYNELSDGFPSMWPGVREFPENYPEKKAWCWEDFIVQLKWKMLALTKKRYLQCVGFNGFSLLYSFILSSFLLTLFCLAAREVIDLYWYDYTI